MAKPTFVFVPGAWHSNACFEGLTSALSTYGYASIAVPTPSVGANPPHLNFDQDVAAIRAAVTKLVVEECKEVIVVVHSYGGMPGTEALEELTKKDREATGQRGGVLRMVFMMAFVVAEGEGFFEFDEHGFGPEAGWRKKVGSFVEVSEDGLTGHGSSTLAPSSFYNDLPSATAKHYMSLLQHQSMGVFFSKVTYAAWRYIPSTYFIFEDDQALPVPFVEGVMLQKRKAEGGFDIERFKGGHFAWLSEEGEREVVGALRRAATEGL